MELSVEIRLMEEGIAKLEDTIARREASQHPEKYVQCLKADKITLAYMKDHLARLKGRPYIER